MVNQTSSWCTLMHAANNHVYEINKFLKKKNKKTDRQRQRDWERKTEIERNVIVAWVRNIPYCLWHLDTLWYSLGRFRWSWRKYAIRGGLWDQMYRATSSLAPNLFAWVSRCEHSASWSCLHVCCLLLYLPTMKNSEIIAQITLYSTSCLGSVYSYQSIRKLVQMLLSSHKMFCFFSCLFPSQSIRFGNKIACLCAAEVLQGVRTLVFSLQWGNSPSPAERSLTSVDTCRL